MSILMVLMMMMIVPDSSPCQPRVIHCPLPLLPSALHCSCTGSPDPGNIQNLMGESYSSLSNLTSKLVLSKCTSAAYYNIKLNFGQEFDKRGLEEHNNIVKYEFQNFESVTIHLGRMQC